jgi:hypothetical protein
MSDVLSILGAIVIGFAVFAILGAPFGTPPQEVPLIQWLDAREARKGARRPNERKGR